MSTTFLPVLFVVCLDKSPHLFVFREAKFREDMYAKTTHQTLIADVHCSGQEGSVLDCLYTEKQNTSRRCGPYNQVGVYCGTPVIVGMFICTFQCINLSPVSFFGGSFSFFFLGGGVGLCRDSPSLV